MLKIEENAINRLSQYLDLDENNPEKISTIVLNKTATSFTSKRCEMFANEEFIQILIEFNDCFSSNDNKILRNSILSIGHVCIMYSYYPNIAFRFIWKYKDDKKLMYYISRSVDHFPQFLKQEGYINFLLNLPKATPKKSTIHMLYQILSDFVKDIDDEDVLMEFIQIFKTFIEKNPSLYESTRGYPKIISEIDAQIKKISP